jgi:hypothetical protein
MFTISSAVFLLISSCRPNCRSKHISGVGGQMAPKSGILEPSKHTSGAEVSTFRNSGNYTDQLVKVPKGPRQRRKDTHFLQNGIHIFFNFARLEPRYFFHTTLLTAVTGFLARLEPVTLYGDLGTIRDQIRSAVFRWRPSTHNSGAAVHIFRHSCQHSGNEGSGRFTRLSILYYNYCMMLWISRSEGLRSVTVNNL